MINLSSFNTSELIILILIMIGTYFILKELCTARYHGKLIIMVGERRYLVMFWIVILALWVVLLIKDTREYMHYRELLYIDSILNHVLWIEVCILNILGSIKHSQIRERGVYISFHFFKWSRIRSYTWILPDIVELRIAILFRVKLKFKLILNKLSDKSYVDKILQRYIIS